MNKRALPLELRVLAGVVCVAALAALLWPAPKLAVEPFAEGVAAPAAEIGQHTLSADRLTPLFSPGRLPRAQTPPPSAAPAATIDPAAALKRHRLLGVTINEHEAVALVTDGARRITLKEGDRLAGFAVSAIRPRQVMFEKDGVRAVISLP